MPCILHWAVPVCLQTLLPELCWEAGGKNSSVSCSSALQSVGNQHSLVAPGPSPCVCSSEGTQESLCTGAVSSSISLGLGSVPGVCLVPFHAVPADFPSLGAVPFPAVVPPQDVSVLAVLCIEFHPRLTRDNESAADKPGLFVFLPLPVRGADLSHCVPSCLCWT